MAATFSGIYRAKAVKIEGQKLTAQIPQVYGEASVVITEFIGSVPTTPGMGYVSFRSGDAAFPVWHGGGGGGGGSGTVTDTLWVGADPPEDDSIELWYDTDEDAALDPRYVDVTGDTMTGALSWAGASVYGPGAGDLSVSAGTTGGSISFKTGGVTRMAVENARVITSLPFEVGADPVAPLQVVTLGYGDSHYGSTLSSTMVSHANANLVTVAVVRTPLLTGGSWLTLSGSCRNNKGSNWVAGDDLFTLPSGFRPGFGGTLLPAVNTDTLANTTFGVTSGGLVEHTAGTVGFGQYIRFDIGLLGT